MSQTLFPGIDTTCEGIVEGEIESFSTDRIVIVGNFTPGDVIELRVGRRVALMTDAALEAGTAFPEDSELRRQLEASEEELEGMTRERDEADDEIAALRDGIQNAIDTLEDTKKA